MCCVGVKVLVSVAEHHSNLVPWQLICQATGATLKHVPLTKDGRELDMQVYFFLTSIHVVVSEYLLCWTGSASVGIVIAASSLMLQFAGFCRLAQPKDKGGGAGACLKYARKHLGYRLCG